MLELSVLPDKYMPSELPFPWRWTEIRKWEKAFSLPALPWASSFIPLMGLPSAMIEHPEIWKSIYAGAMTEYETRLELKNWEIGIPGGRARLVQQIFGKAFEQLATQLSKEVAVGFEKWILLHFFNRKFELAMNSWDCLLRGASKYPDVRRDQIPLPQAFLPLLRELAKLVSYKRQREIEASIKNVAPPPAEEQIPYEKTEYCYEAWFIQLTIEKASTLKALQIIAAQLNEPEQAEVVDWAKAQARVWHWGSKPENLHPDLYLRAEMPSGLSKQE
jgi:hypothetical protein